MIKSLNTAATGMQAQQSNMDVIANNLANTSTVGFKKSRAEFEDLLYQTQKEPGTATGLNSISPTGIQTGLGVRTSAIQKDLTEGSGVITNRPLDFRIDGNGFFQLQMPDGSVGYTRDGQFKKDANGKLVDKNGNSLQPEITIPADARGFEVTKTGEVMVLSGNPIDPPRTIGQLDIVTMINPAGMKALGGNVFASTPSSGQPITARPGSAGVGYIFQGEVESSNVNIVDEMVAMITSQRAYETNAKAVQAADQMLQSVNNLR